MCFEFKRVNSRLPPLACGFETTASRKGRGGDMGGEEEKAPYNTGLFSAINTLREQYKNL